VSRALAAILTLLVLAAAFLALRTLLAEHGSAQPVEVHGLKSLVVSSTPSRSSFLAPVESTLLERIAKLARIHRLLSEAAWTSLLMKIAELSRTWFSGVEPLETQLSEKLVGLRPTSTRVVSAASTSLRMLVSRLVAMNLSASQPSSSTMLEKLTSLRNSSSVVALGWVRIRPSKYFRNGSIGAGIVYRFEAKILDPLGGVYALRNASIAIYVGGRAVAYAVCSGGSCLCRSLSGSCRAWLRGDEGRAIEVLATRIPWSVGGAARIVVRYSDFLGFSTEGVQSIRVVNAVAASIRANTSIVVEGGPVAILVKARYRGTSIPAPNLSIDVNGSALCRTDGDGLARCLIRAPTKPGIYYINVSVPHGPSKLLKLRVVTPQQALRVSACIRGRYVSNRVAGAGHAIHVDVHAYHLVPLIRIVISIESRDLLEATYIVKNRTLYQRGVLRVTSLRIWRPDSEDLVASFAIAIPWNVSGLHTIRVTVVGAGVSRTLSETVRIVNATQVSSYEVLPYPLPPGSMGVLRLVLTYLGTSIPAGGEVVYVNGTRIVADPSGVAVYRFRAPSAPGRIVFVIDPLHGNETDVSVKVSPRPAPRAAISVLGGYATTLATQSLATIIAVLGAATLIAALHRCCGRRS